MFLSWRSKAKVFMIKFQSARSNTKIPTNPNEGPADIFYGIIKQIHYHLWTLDYWAMELGVWYLAGRSWNQNWTCFQFASKSEHVRRKTKRWLQPRNLAEWSPDPAKPTTMSLEPWAMNNYQEVCILHGAWPFWDLEEILENMAKICPYMIIWAYINILINSYLIK